MDETIRALRAALENKTTELQYLYKKFRYLEANVDGMAMVIKRDQSGIYSLLYTTDASERMFGVSPEALIDDWSLFTKPLAQEERSLFTKSLDVSAKNMEAEREQLESQLRQAQKMEAIGSLAGGIAHDFNNILFPIITFTELVLRNMPEGSIDKASLEDVLMAAHRAKDLVGQILAFSRQANSEIESLYLSNLVEEVLRLVRPSLPSTIEVVYKRPESIGQILADPTQIHQIIMNLISKCLPRNGGAWRDLDRICW